MASVQTVGVAGAGVMGTGVAQALAQTGHEVVVVDVSPQALEAGRGKIRQGLRFQRLYSPGKECESSEETLSRVTFSTDYGLFERVDFVVENVPEKWEIKRAVYRQIDEICPPHCIFAVNTSTIRITRVGSVTKRPAQVIGMHFMNPVPLKPTVEVIRGFHTSDATVAAARDFLAGMGKECILVNDSPGFVSNRILMLTVNEAAFVVQDRVAAVEDVDRIFKRCFDHKMGPLETADLIGLDTVLYSIEALYEDLNDPKYRPCPLLRQMVDAGLYGRKSGQGFYTYQE